MNDQNGFSFDQEIPPKQFSDDPTPPMRYPDHPGYQDTDTSKRAAIDIQPKAGRLRDSVYSWLKFAYPKGYTVHEMAKILMKPIPSIQPRFSELRAKGLIMDIGVRRVGDYGKMQIVWGITANKHSSEVNS